MKKKKWIKKVYKIISRYEKEFWDVPNDILGILMDLQTEIEDSGVLGKK